MAINVLERHALTSLVSRSMPNRFYVDRNPNKDDETKPLSLDKKPIIALKQNLINFACFNYLMATSAM
ncbi:MAG: hypothetical protein QX196_15170 [Methylococcaceae bacterium]